MAKKTYWCNWKFEHDGLEYAQGEEISLDEKIATPLVGGVLSETAPEAPATENTGDVIEEYVAELEGEKAALEKANKKLEGEKAALEKKLADLQKPAT